MAAPASGGVHDGSRRLAAEPDHQREKCMQRALFAPRVHADREVFMFAQTYLVTNRLQSIEFVLQFLDHCRANFFSGASRTINKFRVAERIR
jgi:hypothetical protein